LPIPHAAALTVITLPYGGVTVGSGVVGSAVVGAVDDGSNVGQPDGSAVVGSTEGPGVGVAVGRPGATEGRGVGLTVGAAVGSKVTATTLAAFT
jgi:hypothetical protein